MSTQTDIAASHFTGLEPAMAEFLEKAPRGYRNLDEIAQVRLELAASSRSSDDSEVDGVTIRNVDVMGDDGRLIPVRLYLPKERRGGGVIIDLHPGGFVLGGLETTYREDIRLARELSVPVVSVDYRLAPEFAYPAGLEDCFTVLTWVADGASGVNVDPERIVVHGFSAGGGLAAALSMLTVDRGGPSIAFLYLGAPQLDDRLNTDSMRELADTPGFSRVRAEVSWAAYLGELVPSSAGIPEYAAPARRADLSGIPKTFILAMEYDPLRDEAIAFANRLQTAGIHTGLHLVPAAFHGAERVAASTVAQRIAAEQLTVLAQALHGNSSGEAR